MYILAIIAAAAGLGLGYFLPGRVKTSTADYQDQVKKAHEEAEKIKTSAAEQFEHIKKNLDREESDLEETSAKSEEVIKNKEEIAEKRENRNRGLEGNLKGLRVEIENIEKGYGEFSTKIIEKLSHVSGIDPKTALEQSRKELEKLITENKEGRLSAQAEEIKEDAPRHAKAIIQIVAQRLSTPSSVDKNSTMVTLKEDKFKGLFVGKGGTNILYFETLLPVAIIFNLDPQTIHVGGVNLLRRNIAKKAIDKMQILSKKTGKIDHEMIKKTIEEAEKEVMDICDRKGAEHLRLLEIDPKKVDPQLVNYFGRMYFRTSFGQNVIWHSTEMGYLARMISEQIGAEVTVATEGAFYHDIGKAIDHDVGGAHDDLSKEILEKYGYDPRIVHAAFAHHDKVPCIAPEDFIVKAVDAISAVRPGARQESVTNYFERIKQLEDTVASFAGVKKTYAISAGREVRVYVDNDKIGDDKMEGLAEGIAGKISEELSFPGIIKVNLIRYTKSTDYARESNKKPTRQ
ncbi:MAG: HDIG domain-containing metalloprotein [Patescibacteria group bacterium]